MNDDRQTEIERALRASGQLLNEMLRRLGYPEVEDEPPGEVDQKVDTADPRTVRGNRSYDAVMVTTVGAVVAAFEAALNETLGIVKGLQTRLVESQRVLGAPARGAEEHPCIVAAVSELTRASEALEQTSRRIDAFIRAYVRELQGTGGEPGAGSQPSTQTDPSRLPEGLKPPNRTAAQVEAWACDAVADLIAAGWKDTLAGQISKFVPVWPAGGAVNVGCWELARWARDIEQTLDAFNKAVKEGVRDVAERVGLPAVAAIVVAQLAVRIPQSWSAERVLREIVRMIRVIGVAVCVEQELPLKSCQCLADLVESAGRDLLKTWIEAGLEPLGGPTEPPKAR